jgi:arylsulfatase A-like enzyme/Flp pilus assembly protein TadD
MSEIRRPRWTRWGCWLAFATLAVSIGAGGTRTFRSGRSGTPPNLLLITLDTTRADHLGCYGARDALTPALDALAARGTVFDRAYTASPLTLPSHTTIMTGLEPPEHGLRVNGTSRLASDVPTLAEILAGRGYRTGAFVAAFVLNHQFGLDRGFATYDDDLSGARKQTVSERLSVYRPGDRVVDAALAWLERTATAGAPFFAWVHLYDPHKPDYPNDALSGTRFAGVASYDAEIAFTDRQVGRLLDFLDRHGLRDQTLVVAVADHGEGLGDHGEEEHGYLLNEEVLHVPLIMALPGVVRAGQHVGAMVSSIDVLPTALDLLGVDHPRRGRGRSLRPALAGGDIPSMASYAETDLPYTVFGWSPLRGLTTDGWRYVRTKRPELYDRATDRDELRNLFSEEPTVAAGLERELTALEHTFADASAPPLTLDADARRRLEALGYLESAAPAAAPASQQALRDVKDMLAVKHLGAQLAVELATGQLDTAGAIPVARELVARSPESSTFHSRLGELLLATGQLDDAARELGEAVRLRPDGAETRNNLGQVLVRQGKYQQAIAHLTEAVRLRPDLAEAHLGLGLAESARGWSAPALRHFGRAVRLEPTSADAHLNLGNALARAGRPVPAAHEYREALRQRPDFALAHHDLAALLARRDQLPGALEHAREAVRLAPEFAAAQDQLGRLLAEDGQTDAAIVAYEAAVRRAPETPEFRDDLAAAYAAADRPADAETAAREALARAKAAGREQLAADVQRRLTFYERQARRRRTGRV